MFNRMTYLLKSPSYYKFNKVKTINIIKQSYRNEIFNGTQFLLKYLQDPNLKPILFNDFVSNDYTSIERKGIVWSLIQINETKLVLELIDYYRCNCVHMEDLLIYCEMLAYAKAGDIKKIIKLHDQLEDKSTNVTSHYLLLACTYIDKIYVFDIILLNWLNAYVNNKSIDSTIRQHTIDYINEYKNLQYNTDRQNIKEYEQTLKIFHDYSDINYLSANLPDMESWTDIINNFSTRRSYIHSLLTINYINNIYNYCNQLDNYIPHNNLRQDSSTTKSILRLQYWYLPNDVKQYLRYDSHLRYMIYNNYRRIFRSCCYNSQYDIAIKIFEILNENNFHIQPDFIIPLLNYYINNNITNTNVNILLTIKQIITQFVTKIIVYHQRRSNKSVDLNVDTNIDEIDLQTYDETYMSKCRRIAPELLFKLIHCYCNLGLVDEALQLLYDIKLLEDAYNFFVINHLQINSRIYSKIIQAYCYKGEYIKALEIYRTFHKISQSNNIDHEDNAVNEDVFDEISYHNIAKVLRENNQNDLLIDFMIEHSDRCNNTNTNSSIL